MTDQYFRASGERHIANCTSFANDLHAPNRVSIKDPDLLNKDSHPCAETANGHSPL